MRALVVVLAGLACLSAGQTVCDVSGSVVDVSGRPVGEAEIARWFMLDQGRFIGNGAMRVDAQGKFSWKILRSELPATYIALDRTRELGACVKLTAKDVAGPVRIVLKPLAEISFRPKVENDYGPVSMTTSFGYPDATAIVVQTLEPGPYWVPEGTYEISVFGPDLRRFGKRFTARAGQKVDLGTPTLELSPIARNIGKPALPIEFAEARGVDPGFRLQDLKGKWVLLEFWGFW